MRPIYLPAYSLDLNPIEVSFIKPGLGSVKIVTMLLGNLTIYLVRLTAVCKTIDIACLFRFEQTVLNFKPRRDFLVSY